MRENKNTTYSPHAQKYSAKTNTRKLIRSDGVTIWYSFGTPIGFAIKHGLGYVNGRGYSVTTAKHKNYMFRDLDFPKQKVVLPESQFEYALREAVSKS